MMDVEEVTGVLCVVAVAIGCRSVLKGMEGGVAEADLPRVLGLPIVADGREEEERNCHFSFPFYLFVYLFIYFMS